ncbi:MAG: bifunctional precorrin-2 dehydrogenase/sirohydrochlorin ferrochelatase [Desulfobulbaceae bacterium]|uniref:precorrin-2 dehydrogenase n=1 Tax=Candidatus Desulfobia pelagia TaxID=2841692 RepID=A0A8J6TGF1_9BACT|nr:bifunctional precorrin-2 dehydrogenase/sirohydrochlorin ferrochelatase [Candidatus Desulfobia pelagia]
MNYFPINLDIRNRACIVIGGGKVALRKTQGLLNCGGKVTIISPKLEKELTDLVQMKQITWEKRPYKTGDLRKAFLVISATDDPLIQEAVYAEAEHHNLLVNVADVPKWCNFILPATVERGDLSISVSTSGKSPALAKKLRKDLEKQFGLEYDLVLKVLGRLRPVVLAKERSHRENKILFEKFLHPDLIDWVRQRNWPAIHSHVTAILGTDIPIETLIPESLD